LPELLATGEAALLFYFVLDTQVVATHADPSLLSVYRHHLDPAAMLAAVLQADAVIPVNFPFPTQAIMSLRLLAHYMGMRTIRDRKVVDQ
jgi:hypothetical protein